MPDSVPAPTPDTVTEAVAQLTAEGYTADYQLQAGALRASSAGTAGPPCAMSDAVVERMYRFEGPSDPGDEMVVFGIRDPKSGVRGSLVSAFGMAADPEVLDQLTYLASAVEASRRTNRAWRAGQGLSGAAPAAPDDRHQAANDLAGLREDYRQNGLDLADVDPDPFIQFRSWFDVWAATEPYDANAMVLATADAAGRPAARYVLLKGVSDDGFVFYTNRRSRKGDDLASNPHAALCFGWLDLARQVRVEGSVSEVDDTESDAYFAMRPRGSQLGASVSEQSAVIANRVVLEAGLAEVTEQFEGREVTRPPHWGGYRLHPDMIEFWQGRANRLHDRLRYTRNPSDPTGWRIDRLAP